jgi:uncharacterized protein YodC (DUF2158 family)
VVQEHQGVVEGELVRLGNDGPLMAVKFTIGDLVLCVWSDAAGRTRRGTFSRQQLHVVGDRELLYVRVLARLASRFPVVAAAI